MAGNLCYYYIVVFGDLNIEHTFAEKYNFMSGGSVLNHLVVLTFLKFSVLLLHLVATALAVFNGYNPHYNVSVEKMS